MDTEKKVGILLFGGIVASAWLVTLFGLEQTREAFFPIDTLTKWIVSVVVLGILSFLFQDANYKMPKMLLWAGFLGNVASFLLWHSYLDFIPTGISYINTADLVIGIGCILFLRAVLISWRLHS